MNGYRIPAGFGEAEYVEKRSRFIGRVWHTETEEEALVHIQAMREKHWDATHNVYAYIIRGGAMRYSDDGEPQGTSGQPTLRVFQSEEITNVCCVITRYFGGVLLGAGGLVRAYSHTAKLALDKAGIAVMGLWTRLEIPCPYNQYERLKKEIAAASGQILDTDYGAQVTICALLPQPHTPAFLTRVADVTAGTVQPRTLGEEYQAVPLALRNS